jgi:hypothetical protein
VRQIIARAAWLARLIGIALAIAIVLTIISLIARHW